MKTHFSRVVALGVLGCVSASSWAQTKPASDSEEKSFGNKFGWSTVDALAMIGAFHNKINYSTSYRGRLVINSTENYGEVSFKTIKEIQSVWICDAKKVGSINKSKSAESSTSKLTTPDATFIGIRESMNDGVKMYFSNVSDKFWGEKRFIEAPFSSYLVRYVWSSALSSAQRGVRLTVERQIIDGREQISVKDATVKQWILDAKTGDLIYFMEIQANRTQEIRWLKQEFGVKLPPSAFVWKVPQGAKQIVPADSVIGQI